MVSTMDKPNESPQPGEDVLKEMHKTFLEALRQREQEIFSYLTTLGLALGGFAWLMVQAADKQHALDKTLFMFGTFGALALLAFGALYALSLGYNYRYLTFQLAKIENVLKIKTAMLDGWPRTVKDFEKYAQKCDPPEIIKVFWYAFNAGILLITVFAAIVSGMPIRICTMGVALLIIRAGCGPRYFTRKFRGLWVREHSWESIEKEEVQSGK